MILHQLRVARSKRALVNFVGLLDADCAQLKTCHRLRLEGSNFTVEVWLAENPRMEYLADQNLRVTINLEQLEYLESGEENALLLRPDGKAVIALCRCPDENSVDRLIDRVTADLDIPVRDGGQMECLGDG